MTSAALALTHAISGVRNGHRLPIVLPMDLTPAQAGSAIRIVEAGGLVAAEDEPSLAYAKAILERTFGDSSEASRLIGRSSAEAPNFDLIAGRWFDYSEADRDQETMAGYWLADAFIRGVDARESVHLARFLGGQTFSPPVFRLPSARRYPSGGISEKQALLLPPLMRALSDEFGWCSPFLIAAKLAHTGGTRDKLSILPGFSPTSAQEATHWDGRVKPVCYFSAGEDLCPRDAVMYRLRGETGTVADKGLMAASIMSKQIALPADVIVLDILYGSTAFLADRLGAEEFGHMCIEIGRSHQLKVTTTYREASNFLGCSIGASTEVLEAAQILKGGRHHATSALEIETSLNFLRLFAEGLNLPAHVVALRAEQAIESGLAFEAMLTLWREHGVDPDFILKFRVDARTTLLGSLPCVEFIAPRSGLLTWNHVGVADIINQRLNLSLPEGGISPGGIDITTLGGSFVAKGDLLASIYGEGAAAAVDALRATASIVSTRESGQPSLRP